MNRRYVLIICSLLICLSEGHSQSIRNKLLNIPLATNQVDGVIVILDDFHDQKYVNDGADLGIRFNLNSIAKVMEVLIGFEEGSFKDTNIQISTGGGDSIALKEAFYADNFRSITAALTKTKGSRSDNLYFKMKVSSRRNIDRRRKDFNMHWTVKQSPFKLVEFWSRFLAGKHNLHSETINLFEELTLEAKSENSTVYSMTSAFKEDKYWIGVYHGWKEGKYNTWPFCILIRDKNLDLAQEEIMEKARLVGHESFSVLGMDF